MMAVGNTSYSIWNLAFDSIRDSSVGFGETRLAVKNQLEYMFEEFAYIVYVVW